MDTVKLVAEKRQETGKGAARRLRRAGKLPVVVYGRGASEALTIDARELLGIRQAGGANTIIDLEIGGESEVTNVILREVQIDPVSRTQVHADFYRVDLNEPITVTVALEFVNVPEDRFKIAQVELSVLSRDLQVQCLPREIPDTLPVDLQEMEAGGVIHAGDITLPAGVSLISNPEEALAATATITVVEVEEEVAEPGEGVAAEAAPVAAEAATED